MQIGKFNPQVGQVLKHKFDGYFIKVVNVHEGTEAPWIKEWKQWYDIEYVSYPEYKPWNHQHTFTRKELKRKFWYNDAMQILYGQ